MSGARRTGIAVAGTVLLVVLLAIALRGPLVDRILVVALHKTLGLNATIASVGGNLLGDVELRGIAARGETGSGPFASFAADRVSARYTLGALLHGTAAFLETLEVTVEGARVDVDLTRPPAAAVAAKPAGQPAGAPAFPRLPRLVVRDAQVTVKGQGYALTAAGMQGEVARADREGGQALQLSSAQFTLRHPSVRERTISLALEGRSYARRLAITSVKLDGEPLVERASLELGERPGDLDLQLALRLWQGTAELGLRKRESLTEARWDVRGVDLQPQQVLVSQALGALRGQLISSGALALGSGGVSSLTGTLALDWKGALLAGRTVDHLTIKGSAQPGAVLVERAEGLIGPNEVQLHQVKLPAEALFDGRWRALLATTAGSFNASLGDVPAFLALWGLEVGKNAAKVPAHHLGFEGTLDQGVVRIARGDLATGPGKAVLIGVTVTLPREDRGWDETKFDGRANVDIPNLGDLSALFPLPPLGGSLRAQIDGAGSFTKPQGSLSLTGRRISVSGRQVGDVDLRARGTGERIEVDALEVRQGVNRLVAQGVGFSPAALASGDGGALLASLAGSFSLHASDVPALATLAGVPADTLSRTPAKHLLAVAGTVQGGAISISEASFAAAGGQVALRGGRITLPAAGGDWRNDTTFAGALEIDVPDLGPIASLLQLPKVTGSFSARGKIAGSAGAPSAELNASGKGIVAGSYRVGDVVLRATAQQQRLEIETLEVGRGEDRLRGRGAVDLAKGTVLAAEADLDIVNVAPYLAEFVREGIPVSGRLRARLRAAGPLPDAPLAVEAEFSEGRVWDARGVRGRVKAQVTLQGPLRQFRVGAASLVAEVQGEARGREAQSRLEATYEPGRLRVGAFELSGSRGLAVKGEGTVPLDLSADDILVPGPITIRTHTDIPALEILAPLLPPEYALAGSLRADLGVTGSWKEPEARLEIHGEGLQLPAGTRFVPPAPSTIEGTLTWDKAGARAEKIRLESPSLSFSLSGAWSSPPTLPSLFTGAGDAKAGSLALRASFSSPEIGWLQKSIVGLRGLRGTVAGEIAVDGPPGDPVVSGAIRIAAGAVRYQNLPPFESLAAKASLAQRSVNLEAVSGTVGGSPFTLTGSVDFSRLDNPTLNLRLQGQDTLLYRDEGLRVRADSDLALRGPVSALSLTGEVAITNSLYQKTISVVNLFSGGGKSSKGAAPGTTAISFPEPPLRDLRFDVRLTARKPFQIKTTVVRGTARPDLRLTGTGLLPILRGPVLFDNMEVFLPSGTLEVERGSMLFGEKDPRNPVLDFGGRMQLSGYEITAQVGGTLDNPEVVLASTPPLLQEELLLFVLTGAPPASGSTDGSASGSTVSAMATPMAVYLGKGVLEEILGGANPSGGSDIAGRLELQVGREMTRSGSSTVEARLRLKRNFLTRGDTLFLTSEKDVYDQENLGLKIVFKFK